MILADVNIVVYAFRHDSPNHQAFRTWLEDVINSDASFAVSELVLSAFLRIVTHPRVFDPPTPLLSALEFADAIRAQPNGVLVTPGMRHWTIFSRLCRESGARGNLIPDAYVAALAIESGCEFVTTDRDFSRFPGLQWRTPF